MGIGKIVKLFAGVVNGFKGCGGASADMPSNANVRRGRWGEDVAVNHLKKMGWRILGRNERPCIR